jgi:2-haloacid dehalogenase
VPATQKGMTKVWINRRHNLEGLGATAPPQGDYTIEYEFNSMADFVEAHSKELAGG